MSAEYKIPDEFLNSPREEEITKDEYYMALAEIAAKRSPDPSTQVGVCYVSKDGEVLSLGYNHPPKRWKGPFIWNRETKTKDGDEIDPFFTKYPYIIHAEVDGIKEVDYEGSTCYVTLFPCSNCAKMIENKGITRVVYLHMGNINYTDVKSSLYLLQNSGIEVVSFDDIKREEYEGLELNVDPEVKDNVKIVKRSLTPQFDK